MASPGRKVHMATPAIYSVRTNFYMRNFCHIKQTYSIPNPPKCSRVVIFVKMTGNSMAIVIHKKDLCEGQRGKTVL